jgi:CRP/FNR family transcriptional regulator, cyclic AMP receptor protein
MPFQSTPNHAMSGIFSTSDHPAGSSHALSLFFDCLSGVGTLRNIGKEAILIREGDAAGSLFLIKSGRFRVISEDDRGRQVVIDEHGPGGFVGELSLDGRPRSATVMATEPGQVIEVERDAAIQAMVDHPEVAWALVEELIFRTRKSTENLKSLALFDVYGRIVRLLGSLAAPEGTRQRIANVPTQVEIAKRVGASRDMVSLIMRDLTTGGYLTREGTQLFINRPLPQRW